MSFLGYPSGCGERPRIGWANRELFEAVRPSFRDLASKAEDGSKSSQNQVRRGCAKVSYHLLDQLLVGWAIFKPEYQHPDLDYTSGKSARFALLPAVTLTGQHQADLSPFDLDGHAQVISRSLTFLCQMLLCYATNKLKEGCLELGHG